MRMPVRLSVCGSTPPRENEYLNVVFTKSLEIYSEEYSFKEQVVRVTVRTLLSGYRTLVEENRPKMAYF